jgi:hypothetical protein
MFLLNVGRGCEPERPAVIQHFQQLAVLLSGYDENLLRERLFPFGNIGLISAPRYLSEIAVWTECLRQRFKLLIFRQTPTPVSADALTHGYAAIRAANTAVKYAAIPPLSAPEGGSRRSVTPYPSLDVIIHHTNAIWAMPVTETKSFWQARGSSTRGSWKRAAS